MARKIAPGQCNGNVQIAQALSPSPVLAVRPTAKLPVADRTSRDPGYPLSIFDRFGIDSVANALRFPYPQSAIEPRSCGSALLLWVAGATSAFRTRARPPKRPRLADGGLAAFGQPTAQSGHSFTYLPTLLRPTISHSHYRASSPPSAGDLHHCCGRRPMQALPSSGELAPEQLTAKREG